MNKEEVDQIIQGEGDYYRRYYKGFEYWILRHTVLKCLNGYIVINKDSRFYLGDDYELYDIDCHGSLSFSGSRERLSIDFAIGFDCGHDGDYWDSRVGGIYRNVAYVNRQCKSIIDQLLTLTRNENDK